MARMILLLSMRIQSPLRNGSWLLCFVTCPTLMIGMCSIRLELLDILLKPKEKLT